MTGKKLRLISLTYNFKDNMSDIANNLKKLIEIETKNMTSNQPETIKCGLWLTRLCKVANLYQNHNTYDEITWYSEYKSLLSKILLTEINDEYKLANKGKYNVKLLHYITKGLKIANATWFKK